MRLIGGVVTLWLLPLLVMLTSTCGCRPADQQKLSAIAKALDRAIQTNDEALAKSLFVSPAWSRPDEGKSLFDQGVRKRFTLRPMNISIVRDRAVIALDVRRSDRVVDREWLYLLRVGEAWTIEAVDETKAHPKLFLDGVLPAYFNVEALQGDPELEQFGLAMLAVATGRDEARATLQAGGFDAEELSDILAQLAKLYEPAIVTHVSEDLGLGVLVFTPRRSVSALGDTVVLAVARQGRQWKVVENIGPMYLESKLLRVHAHLPP